MLQKEFVINRICKIQMQVLNTYENQVVIDHNSLATQPSTTSMSLDGDLPFSCEVMCLVYF